MYSAFFKRTFDLIFGVIFAVLGMIPMIIISIIIALTSKGGIIFKQTRFGKDSRPFSVFKFRTMYTDSPIVSAQAGGDVVESHVTTVGHVLRKTSLDELPQLWNVLVGEMSFVGPRPLAGTDSVTLKLRTENGADRVRPGITGLAQVSGRNEVSEVEKAEIDSLYASNVSFRNDLKIVLLTLKHVFLMTGIYKSESSKSTDSIGK